MAENNNQNAKSGKGWIIGIIIALIAVAIAMAIAISKRAQGETPYDYNLDEYITIGEYSDLPYYTEEFTVTEEEIQGEIDYMLQSNSVTETLTDGVVEEGDTINIAFVGRIDGEEFAGGTSESFDLTVGETSMIEGFVEGLMGKKMGETVSLDLKFPEDYGAEELNGKPVVFDVTINGKKITTVPELTEEFVKEKTQYETIENLRKEIEKFLLTDKENALDSTIKGAMWSKVQENSQVLKYPEAEYQAYQEQADAMDEEYKAMAEIYEMEWEEYISTFLGTDEEGYQEMKKEYLEETVKDELLTYAIARKEKIKMSNSEYEKEIKQILEDSGYTEEAFQNAYGMTLKEYAEENNWRYIIFRDKVLDAIKAKGKEVSKEEFDEYYASEEVTIEPLTEEESGDN